MMRLDLPFFGLAAAWGVAEIAAGLAHRARRAESSGRDRGSMLLLWGAITLGFGSAFWLLQRRLAPIPVPVATRLPLAMVVMLAGIVLRGWAIVTLGRLFTMNVAIREGHELIETGPYRWLRHPSYAGALLAFLGFAFGLGDALALAVLLVPTAVAMVYRIHVEERALRETFGARWNAYAATRPRLVPFVY